ncbi:ARID/BRIGHT DNA binding domain [Musa troglodytarum]|uniref:ARID/BRIGHT DNA binding domain n=1 Tax=Musa troglodytarum TaxID=320322 RepID=A0A9E7FWF5_9LILI|nr:ARID/BRIGHT DNA binding domain [Musa troglodytarum]URE03615.1 ARID/BRIGHT DNA binding domain [Musa troglodytarum]
MLSSLVSPPLPMIGVPYIIYWKSAFSSYAASHFRQGLLSVVQSSCSHTWDAFQLAHASYRLYCTWNNQFVPDSNQKLSSKLGSHLLGDSPKINIPIPEKDLDLRFLVCGLSCTLDACLLGSLEDGLNALLNIELLECHIKSALIEKSQLVHAVPNSEGRMSSLLNPLNSVSMACGASVFEVHMRVPTWAAQVLKYLAPEVSYRSLVTLGIASIQGISVASFEMEDADRLLFFCRRQGMDFVSEDDAASCRPR